MRILTTEQYEAIEKTLEGHTAFFTTVTELQHFLDNLYILTSPNEHGIKVKDIHDKEKAVRKKISQGIFNVVEIVNGHYSVYLAEFIDEETRLRKFHLEWMYKTGNDVYLDEYLKRVRHRLSQRSEAKPLMACGHLANAFVDEGKPACAICGETTVSTLLSGLEMGDRVSRCVYCQKEVSSKPTLPFFKFSPKEKYDEHYCGCRGWN